jgi:two-component system response regulator RegA
VDAAKHAIAHVKALLASPGEKPEPPDNPMSADRIRWEHIQRVYELCGHNVSETARRLNMHRCTLQRYLSSVRRAKQTFDGASR